MRNDDVAPAANTASVIPACRRTFRSIVSGGAHPRGNCLSLAQPPFSPRTNLAAFFIPNPLIARVCTPLHVNQNFFPHSKRYPFARKFVSICSGCRFEVSPTAQNTLSLQKNTFNPRHQRRSSALGVSRESDQLSDNYHIRLTSKTATKPLIFRGLRRFRLSAKN
jgi:hypothetical protein